MRAKMKRRCYIAWSQDAVIRERASSGGVGSSLVKMLFDTCQITASLSFAFDEATLRYRPFFAHNFSEYLITGSIYHEMEDIFNFYRTSLTVENVGTGPVLVFALPCQVRAIRQIAKSNGIRVYVLGLVCSSQQSLEATNYLFKRLGIDRSDVSYVQYRGNGWPSGVQIKLKDGAAHFIPNCGSVWTEIFHSRLFISRRCFACEDTLNRFADIVLADPWLERFVKTERVGKTLVAVQTEVGEKLFQQASNNGYITTSSLSDSEFILAQRMTIDRKIGYKNNKRLTGLLVGLVNSRLYRFAVLNFEKAFRFHMRIKSLLED